MSHFSLTQKQILVTLKFQNMHLCFIGRRQTILFSATQKSKTEALASVLFEKKKPTRVEVGGIKQMPTVAELRQGYIICPTEKRMLFLLTFLDRPVMRDKKIMVFFSSCLSIKFHHDLFNYINIKVMCIHVSASFKFN